MVLPTKGISPDRALLTIGASALVLLDSPSTVTALWERYTSSSANLDQDEMVTFDWFALALSMLFAIGAIDWNEDGRLEKRDAAA